MDLLLCEVIYCVACCHICCSINYLLTYVRCEMVPLDAPQNHFARSGRGLSLCCFCIYSITAATAAAAAAAAAFAAYYKWRDNAEHIYPSTPANIFPRYFQLLTVVDCPKNVAAAFKGLLPSSLGLVSLVMLYMFCVVFDGAGDGCGRVRRVQQAFQRPQFPLLHAGGGGPGKVYLYFNTCLVLPCPALPCLACRVLCCVALPCLALHALYGDTQGRVFRLRSPHSPLVRVVLLYE